MLRRALIAGVVVASTTQVGCYHPDLRDCTVSCSSAADCAKGLVCNGDGMCVHDGFSGSCSDLVDAALPRDHDAPPIDAKPEPGDDASGAVALCQQGCTNGTCDAQGVCVIDCSGAYACDATDVTCPTNLPCRVVCGDHACSHHVHCALATSCEVQCTGTYACGDVIECNTGPCTVSCSGDFSCKRHTKCDTSCSCDVTCGGASSCMEVSTCPMGTACVLGRGCSSALAGCDTCS